MRLLRFEEQTQINDFVANHTGILQNIAAAVFQKLLQAQFVIGKKILDMIFYRIKLGRRKVNQNVRNKDSRNQFCFHKLRDLIIQFFSVVRLKYFCLSVKYIYVIKF